MPCDDDWNVDSVVEIIRKKRKDVFQRWLQTDVLIIDEVSMLSGKVLDKLDLLASHIRIFNNPDNKPFGGIQMVFVGDFYQLPPVSITGSRMDDVDFCFNAQSWRNVIRSRRNCHVLTIQHRQNDVDDPLSQCLKNIRVGKVDTYTHSVLNSRVIKWEPPERTIGENGCNVIIPTKIMPTNAMVASINKTHYDQLDDSNEHSYTRTVL